MKRRYRTWQMPVLSFYSKEFYRDVALRWCGSNLGFLCLLLILCQIPAARHINHLAAELLDHAAHTYLMQIPPISINEGKVIVDAPQPYSIIDGNHTLLLIDTTGKINTLNDAQSTALLTATHLHIKQRRLAPISYDLSNVKSLQLNQEIATHLIQQAKTQLLPALYIASLVLSFILLLFAVLICGSIARVFGLIQRRSVDYATGLRLAVVAFTPPLILSGICSAFGYTVPPALFILLMFAILYNAVSTCRDSNSNNLYLEDEPVAH